MQPICSLEAKQLVLLLRAKGHESGARRSTPAIPSQSLAQSAATAALLWQASRRGSLQAAGCKCLMLAYEQPG